MVPSILDRFTIHGPNGSHACYVTAPARASLSQAKDGSWIRLFQLDVARSLAAQLVLVVNYVHAQGIVHGDLHLGNVLLKVPPTFDQITLEQLYEKYGAPELDPVKYESRTPLVIRPPEARFEPDEPLSFSSDIWTLACTIWSIIAQRPLFEGFLATEDDITCEQVDTLGVLPPEWWRKWEARRHKFSEDGKPMNRNPFRSWDDRFEDSVQQPRRDSGMPLFDARERDAIFDMLRPMLSFRPENRPTTQQILESEWMRDSGDKDDDVNSGDGPEQKINVDNGHFWTPEVHSFSSRKVAECGDLHEILHGGAPVEPSTQVGITAWISKIYNEAQGFKIGTFIDVLLWTLWRKQSAKWPNLAQGYVSDIISYVHKFIQTALLAACRDSVMSSRILSLLMDDLMENYRQSISLADFLRGIEQAGTPMTLNHYLNDILQKCREKRFQNALAKKAFTVHLRLGDEKVVRLGDIYYQDHMTNVFVLTSSVFTFKGFLRKILS
ncbi:Uncharacterized protein PECH_005775 [Penicillium ucsense]|uniref:Protein kinase domain-containing protein n=1 Tax=Penicillium ucsense TaxID=2839758 RepID=A0A8J8WJR9_9EURO|nr:Uncharacterized protein PECM_006208 [Penicillium ucsense]KAF7736186.1 Uncharacterized protein PECH_005775 [Penicillium ucsense]